MAQARRRRSQPRRAGHLEAAGAHASFGAASGSDAIVSASTLLFPQPHAGRIAIRELDAGRLEGSAHCAQPMGARVLPAPMGHGAAELLIIPNEMGAGAAHRSEALTRP